MRGTPCGRECLHEWHGIIPAHAGNTPAPSQKPSSPRDHPRACGEHRTDVEQHKKETGSSPRMRGTHKGSSAGGFAIGIIPAHAGNTVTAYVMPSCMRDHPRACGEHYRIRLGDEAQLGSSPRMRGTPLIEQTDIAQIGIIPAHAGNTRVMPRPTGHVEDHPRACGEHYRVAIAPVELRGSSPRMRGTRQG